MNFRCLNNFSGIISSWIGTFLALLEASIILTLGQFARIRSRRRSWSHKQRLPWVLKGWLKSQNQKLLQNVSGWWSRQLHICFQCLISNIEIRWIENHTPFWKRLWIVTIQKHLLRGQRLKSGLHGRHIFHEYCEQKVIVKFTNGARHCVNSF